jgi:hypothetical protein
MPLEVRFQILSSQTHCLVSNIICNRRPSISAPALQPKPTAIRPTPRVQLGPQLSTRQTRDIRARWCAGVPMLGRVSLLTVRSQSMQQNMPAAQRKRHLNLSPSHSPVNRPPRHICLRRTCAPRRTIGATRTLSAPSHSITRLPHPHPQWSIETQADCLRLREMCRRHSYRDMDKRITGEIPQHPNYQLRVGR